MENVTVIRTLTSPTGTFGVIQFPGESLYTVERPWLENRGGVSCIPTGLYRCRWTLSPRLKKFTYEVLNVPNRTGIRIHAANFPNQVIGCIALGERIGTIDGRSALLLSAPAVRRFNLTMAQKEFQLEVRNG